MNHLGIRVTRVLTDFSGYWILLVAAAMTVACLAFAESLDLARLVTFTNYTGLPTEKPVWPRAEAVGWAFALGLLLPAYTITGFDASAHAAEETVHAAAAVPRGIVRAVLVSGVFGWVMLCAVVLADILGVVADQPVALARDPMLDLAGRRELEALLDAALGLQLGHFRLLTFLDGRGSPFGRARSC